MNYQLPAFRDFYQNPNAKTFKLVVDVFQMKSAKKKEEFLTTDVNISSVVLPSYSLSQEKYDIQVI